MGKNSGGVLERVCVNSRRLENMKLSIIIPLHNQAAILERTIPSFFNQNLNRQNYEVICVDDGSTDNSLQVLKNLGNKYPIKIISQAGSGPAAARNHGVREAVGEVILFSQDDIIADKKILSRHFAFHQKFPRENFALGGFITWDPQLKITPFMHWLEHGGPQFDFKRLEFARIDPNLPEYKMADHLSFYTPNVSLKRLFFTKNGGFDEKFRVKDGTAYEDLELGWRLQKAGMQLFYDEKAIAYHHHVKTLRDVCRRRVFEGQMSYRLYQKHPDLKLVGQKESVWHQIRHLKTGFLPDSVRFHLTRFIFNKFTVWPLEKLALFLQDKVNVPLLYKIVCGYYYNLGYAKGKN